LPERGTVPRAVVEHHRERLLDRIAQRQPPAPPAPPPAVPRHRLLRLLGAGSAADVWEAEGPDGERVALKLFHAKHGSAQALASSQRRELRASLRLDHPGIVRVLDHGQTDEGRAFLVMELLPGIDLGRLLSREGRLPWPRARTLLLQLC
jgi:serine/threonine protein kinase